MAQTQSQPPDELPDLDRRTFIKTVGAAGGAAAIGATSENFALSPVQDANAITVGGLAIVGGLMAGAYVVGTWQANDEEIDGSGDLATEIYQAAEVQADTRKSWEDEAKGNFTNRNDSNYAELAWTEIRLGTAEARVNGLSVSEAKNQARQALKEQTTRSVINVVERWNTGLMALQEQINADYNNSVGVFRSLNHDENIETDKELEGFGPNESGNYVDNLTAVDPAADDGTHVLWKYTVNTPVDPSQVRDSDEPLEAYCYGIESPSGGSRYINSPLHDGEDSENMLWGAPYIGYDPTVDRGVSTDLGITHGSYDSKVVLDTQLYYNVLDQIQSEYNTIDSDLGTYVENLYDAFAQTDLDPADIIQPTDLYQQYADGSTQQRVNAELIAAGASPSTAGYQVEISHPDLAADSLWGNLYPRYADGVDDQNLTSGSTLSSADYTLAYFGYIENDTGEYTITTLSGNEDLQILSSSDSNAELSENRDTNVDSNNGVQFWDTEQHGEAPDWLQYPGEFSDKELVLNGPENQSTHSLSDIVDNGDGTYSIDTTDLNAGESLEEIRLRDQPTYSQPGYVTSDPTTVDTAQVESQIQDYNDLQTLIENVESHNEDVAAGSWWDSPDIPTLPGLGVFGTGAAAILGFLGISALSS